MNEEEAVFQVRQHAGTLVLKITGRADFSNCSAARAFFKQSYKKGLRHFVVDFQKCRSMDSTFLGVLAELALKLTRGEPSGNLTLCRLAPRNQELVLNLGLQHIAKVQEHFQAPELEQSSWNLEPETCSDQAQKHLVFRAHESLVKISDENVEKFEDLLGLLEEEEGEEEEEEER